jgi:hypothetical protein
MGRHYKQLNACCFYAIVVYTVICHIIHQIVFSTGGDCSINQPCSSIVQLVLGWSIRVTNHPTMQCFKEEQLHQVCICTEMIRICKTSWVHWENIRYTLKPTSKFNAQNPSARFCSDRTIWKAKFCSWFLNSGYIQNIQQSYSRHIYVHVCVCVCVCTTATYNFFENQFMYKNWAGLQGKGFISVVVCLF